MESPHAAGGLTLCSHAGGTRRFLARWGGGRGITAMTDHDEKSLSSRGSGEHPCCSLAVLKWLCGSSNPPGGAETSLTPGEETFL